MYSLAAITIDTTADVVIGQITEQSVSPNIEEMLTGGSGLVDASHVSVSQQAPVIRFATHAVKTMLDAVGIAGLAIDLGADPTIIVELWWRRRSGAGWAGDSLHVKQTVSKGLLVPVSLSAQQGGEPASIVYDLYPIMYGALEPIVTAKLQTCTIEFPAPVYWTIGPAAINTVNVTVVQRVNVEFGLNVVPVFGSGVVWPTDIHIDKREPKIEFDTLEADWLDDSAGLGSKGVAIASETAVWFRKKTAGGTTVIPATEEHIQITATAGRVAVNNAQGNHGSNAVFTVGITPISNLSDAILIISTTAAID